MAPKNYIWDSQAVKRLEETQAGDHGLGSWGNVSSEIRGYPFPSD